MSVTDAVCREARILRVHVHARMQDGGGHAACKWLQLIKFNQNPDGAHAGDHLSAG